MNRSYEDLLRSVEVGSNLRASNAAYEQAAVLGRRVQLQSRAVSRICWRRLVRSEFLHLPVFRFVCFAFALQNQDHAISFGQLVDVANGQRREWTVFTDPRFPCLRNIKWLRSRSERCGRLAGDDAGGPEQKRGEEQG